jgi:broad specificity phosphatase PhoE
MLKVYLLRHGETQYNADGNRYCGRTDISLTDKGLSQADIVYKQLKGVQLDAVYSSPLQRAYNTAKIATGDADVQTDERIIEVDFGQWEGKTKEEFILEDPQSWESWMQDPGNNKAGKTGESALEVVQRVDAFYQEMVQKHPNGTIMVVGHNGINRLYMAYKLGMPLKNYRRIVQENSSITVVSFDDEGEMELMKLNAII